MEQRVRVGQRYQDLDPRRGERVGTVVQVRRFTVRLCWEPSGATTTVRRRMLDAAGSRGYVLIDEGCVAARRRKVSRPTTARACRAGYDERGMAQWRCWVCGRVGALRGPWRELLWTVGRWRERSTVVCSDACHRAMRGGGDAGE